MRILPRTLQDYASLGFSACTIFWGWSAFVSLWVLNGGSGMHSWVWGGYGRNGALLLSSVQIATITYLFIICIVLLCVRKWAFAGFHLFVCLVGVLGILASSVVVE